MTRRGFSVLLSLVLLLGVTALPGWAPAASSEGLAAGPTAVEQRVIDLVNAERAKAGLQPLVYSAPLTTSARNYAGYMISANFFGHVGPDGSNLVTRDQAAGYGAYTFLAENLAAGQTTPEAVMAGWMGSAGHRANILAPAAREIGVGYASGGSYGHYWVQEFGARPASAQPAPAPRVAPAAPAPRVAPAAPAPARATAPSSRGGRPASAAPASALPTSWTSMSTGFTVSGEWLNAFRWLGGLDNLGEPRSGVIEDPASLAQAVQFFQRAVLEYRPENPAPYRIQRRLLTDLLEPGADAPISPADAPPGASTYFLFSTDRPTGLGHFVANATRSGQPIYFKDYFDQHGGVDAFGYPKEEPKLRDGLWTQRFQAAIFEYHPENDRDGVVPGTSVPYRNYRVQLALIGDRYKASLEEPKAAPEAVTGEHHLAQNLAKDEQP